MFVLSMDSMIEIRHLILASSSPRRKDILEKADIPIQVMPAAIEENTAEIGSPEEIAKENAHLKATFIANQNPNALVLGADTVVTLNNKTYHKPKSVDHARDMFREFSGKTQIVYTGLCFASKIHNIDECHAIKSEVSFKRLTAPEIDHYFKLVDPLDRAGGWSIQDHSELIIEGYKGSLANIAGLPIEFIREWLKKHVVFS